MLSSYCDIPQKRMKKFLLLFGIYHGLTACSTSPQQTHPIKNPKPTYNFSGTFQQSPQTRPNQNSYQSVPQTQSSRQLSLGIQQAFDITVSTADRLAPIIIEQARQYNISPFLLAALIMQESSYRSHVKSSAGAIGLTQVIPKYWKSQCNGSLRQEYYNIQCGTYVLSTYSKQAGNWLKALAYYNVGPSAYNNSQKMRQQGKKYAQSVIQYHRSLLMSLNLIKDPHLDF